MVPPFKDTLISQFLRSVVVLPHVVQRTLQMWLPWRTRAESILGYPVDPNLITEAFKKGEKEE